MSGKRCEILGCKRKAKYVEDCQHRCNRHVRRYSITGTPDIQKTSRFNNQVTKKERKAIDKTFK